MEREGGQEGGIRDKKRKENYFLALYRLVTCTSSDSVSIYGIGDILEAVERVGSSFLLFIFKFPFIYLCFVFI